MTMAEPTAPSDEVAEADLLEQHTPVTDTDDDTDNELIPAATGTRWDADEADQLEQLRAAPLPEDEQYDNERNS